MERSRFEQEINGLLSLKEVTTSFESGEKGPSPILLPHWHIRKYLSGGSMLLSDSNETKLQISHMDPNFDTTTKSTRLKSELEHLIRTKYPIDNSKSKPKLYVAVVDLTGAKYHRPVFAGYFENTNIYGASIPKILPIYAYFQLQFDLVTLIKTENIESTTKLKTSIRSIWKKAGLGANLIPQIEKLFKFQEKKGEQLRVSSKVTQDMTSNYGSTFLISSIGFGYIGSLALQSGLYDKGQRGLWINSGYSKSNVTWNNSPFPGNLHGITAFAVAKYFTLMAQGRLINQQGSNDIARVLKKRCLNPGLIGGVLSLPHVPATSTFPNKCGDFGGYVHDSVFIERNLPGEKNISYVAVALTKDKNFGFFELGKDLDALILAQNP
jgi:hypothetical protein